MLYVKLAVSQKAGESHRPKPNRISMPELYMAINGKSKKSNRMGSLSCLFGKLFCKNIRGRKTQNWSRGNLMIGLRNSATEQRGCTADEKAPSHHKVQLVQDSCSSL